MAITELTHATNTAARFATGVGRGAASLTKTTNSGANEVKTLVDSFDSSRSGRDESAYLSDQLRKLSYSNSNSNNRNSANLRPAMNYLIRNFSAGQLSSNEGTQSPKEHNLLVEDPTNQIEFGNPGELSHRPPNQIERGKVVDWLVSQLPENRKKRGEEPISLDWDGKDGKWACVDVYLNGVDQSGVNPGPLMSTLDGTRDVKNLTLTMQQANNGPTKYYRDWNNGTEKQFLRPGQFLILDGEEDYAHSVVVHKVRDVRRGGGCDGPRYDKVIDVIGLSQGKNGPQFSIIEDYESYLSESGFTIRGFGDLPINE